MPASPLVVHVVPHTHWDREWYHPVGRFRQRLVALVDELLDHPLPGEPAGEVAPFLLDGQAVVLDDYLAVRPERAGDLAAALRDRPIEAGPWYVLADELIPGGEALVRNLLAGRRTTERLGALRPPVLYCPDSFGHPAALPLLAAEFGFPVIVAWRGYGGPRWPAGDAAWWETAGAPSPRTLLYHLPRDGYEFGSSLPTEREAMARRWAALRAELAPRARLGRLLVQNGADHHARQRGLGDAFALLREVAAPDEVRWSTLTEFAALALADALDRALPTVQGELRDSYGYTWTLQGTLAARAGQKRRNAHAERLLVREAEPWAALARQGGGVSRRPLVHAAWLTLLRCHPHDTLCGCSADVVAHAMEVRLESARAQAEGVRDDALLALIGHDPVDARERRLDWQSVCVVRNPAPRARAGVAEVELETFVRDVAVGPGSGVRRRAPDALPGAPVALDQGRVPLQLLDRRLEQRRTESPRHYPDNDLVEVARAVAWVDEVAGYGTHSYALGGAATAGEGGAPPAAPVTARDTTLDNGLVTLAVSARGEVRLTTAGGYRSPPLVSFEDIGDAGDLYTHSPTGSPITTAWFVGARLVHRGPLRGEVECRWRMRVPAALRREEPGDTVAPRAPRAGRPVEIPITLRFVLDAGAEHVGVHVDGTNAARDHRLRVLLATGIEQPAVWADAAFTLVERRPLVVAAEDAARELPPPTAPLHRYVSLFAPDRGVTLFSDGLAEYEALADGRLAVTLVRAVGELSRNDLPERPGHAGWPMPTPEGQCPGPFAARLALLAHGARTPATTARVEQVADDVLCPLAGVTLRSALGRPAPSLGAELSGAGLAFGALKESETGDAVVARCVNLTGETVAGRWHFGFPVRGAHLARLDETPLGPAALDAAGDVTFTAGPHAVVTILVE